MNTLTLPAPAKLNLMLHITGRRPDGYHELQTLFQFLELADELGFSHREDGQLQLHTSLPQLQNEENLILRAAHLLRQTSGVQYGVDIYLNKLLPMGGGLGGGSSDAATTLLGLNYLWQLGYSLEQLAILGLQLGEDVPVFVHGQAAFAEGIGEKLTPLNPPEPWYLVVNPGVHINTREIFCNPLLTRNTPAIKVRTVLKQSGRNDCQPVVEMLYPLVSDALKTLGEFTQARLTGTGCCLFGEFPNEAEAGKVAAQLPAGLQSFVAKGSNTSMLHRKLRKLESS